MDADVIVVGGGAAGLAAALELARRSLRAIVVEGRERIGGRVRWEPVGSVAVPAELGAEFIHGAAPLTTALMREAGLDCADVDDAAWECRSPGQLEPAADDAGEDLFERAGSLAEDESVAAFLQRFEHDPLRRAAAQRARAFVEGFEAADPTRASVRSIADEIRSGVDSTTARPVGGYAPLFDHLSARCAAAGVTLQLSTTVTRIVWAAGAVTVETQTASGRTAALRARRAIITVPVGVLQGRDASPLAFAPPLPADKSAALRGLAMGDVVRVTLAFRTPFWEEIAGGRYRDAGFFRCADGAFGVFWTQLPLRDRTIVAWVGGPRAAAFAGTSASERIERARDAFGAMFGEGDRARREFEDGVTHDWSADPFARGAYSYVVSGAGAARADLAAPVADTLFFAGEATAGGGQGGTVNGAFESGVRAAAQVAEANAAMSGAAAPIAP